MNEKTVETDLQRAARRFVTVNNTDLLTLYFDCSKGSKAYLDYSDGKVISELLHSVDRKHSDLTIMLHMRGGVFQVALGLMKGLRSLYSGNINAVILNISKSSGSFIGLSSCKCFMAEAAVISDFSIDKSAFSEPEKIPEYTTDGLELYLQGKDISSFDSAMDHIRRWRSLISAELHASDITFSVAQDKFGVTPIREFGVHASHLHGLHTYLLHEFRNDKSLNKIIGLQGKFVAIDS